MITSKQLMVFTAITDILTIFADTEIGGQYEFDYDTIAEYIDSLRMVNDYFECSTKEDVYKRFTQDIYNGFPVWRMLKLPEWTANMVEKMFRGECEAEYEQQKKTYKCLTCKYFKITQTMLGILEQCTFKKEESRRLSPRRSPFQIKKRCKNYVKVNKDD